MRFALKIHWTYRSPASDSLRGWPSSENTSTEPIKASRYGFMEMGFMESHSLRGVAGGARRAVDGAEGQRRPAGLPAAAGRQPRRQFRNDRRLRGQRRHHPLQSVGADRRRHRHVQPVAARLGRPVPRRHHRRDAHPPLRTAHGRPTHGASRKPKMKAFDWLPVFQRLDPSITIGLHPRPDGPRRHGASGGAAQRPRRPHRLGRPSAALRRRLGLFARHRSRHRLFLGRPRKSVLSPSRIGLSPSAK